MDDLGQAIHDKIEESIRGAVFCKPHLLHTKVQVANTYGVSISVPVEHRVIQTKAPRIGRDACMIAVQAVVNQIKQLANNAKVDEKLYVCMDSVDVKFDQLDPAKDGEVVITVLLQLGVAIHDGDCSTGKYTNVAGEVLESL